MIEIDSATPNFVPLFCLVLGVVIISACLSSWSKRKKRYDFTPFPYTAFVLGVAVVAVGPFMPSLMFALASFVTSIITGITGN